MTINEMHIAVQFALQRQSAGDYTSLEDEEIDLALNIAQDRFINTQVNPTSPTTDTIESSARRQLQNLIVKNYKVPALKPSSSVTSYDGHFYESGMYYGLLPENWLYPLNQRLQVERLKNNRCGNLSIVEDPINKYREYVSILNYVANVDDVCVPSPVLKITIDGVTIFDLSDFPQIQDVYQNIEDKYKVVNLILEFLNRFNSLAELINYADPSSEPIENINQNSSFAVYWEKYGEMYYPSSFIIVTTDPLIGANLTPDDDEVFNSTDSGKEVILITDEDGVTPASTFRFRQRTFIKAKVDDEDESVTGLIETAIFPVRLTDKEDFYIKQRNPFWTSSNNDVQGSFFSNRLLVYTDNSFVPKEIILDYIKRPRRMSKVLSQDCELHNSVHQSIVEHTVAYLLEVSGNPRLQSSVAQRTYYGE